MQLAVWNTAEPSSRREKIGRQVNMFFIQSYYYEKKICLSLNLTLSFVCLFCLIPDQREEVGWRKMAGVPLPF